MPRTAGVSGHRLHLRERLMSEFFEVCERDAEAAAEAWGSFDFGACFQDKPNEELDASTFRKAAARVAKNVDAGESLDLRTAAQQSPTHSRLVPARVRSGLSRRPRRSRERFASIVP